MTDKSHYTAGTGLLSDYVSDVNANFGRSRMLTILSYSAAATLADTCDLALCDATSAAFDLDLPASPVAGDHFVAMKTDAGGNAVTLDGNGNDINGSSSTALASQYDSVHVAFDGTEWFVIG